MADEVILPVDDDFFKDIANTMLGAMTKHIGEIAGPAIIVRNRKAAQMMAIAALKEMARSFYQHGLKEGSV